MNLEVIACRDGSTRVVTSPIVNSYQFMKTTKYIIENLRAHCFINKCCYNNVRRLLNSEKIPNSDYLLKMKNHNVILKFTLF